MQVEPSAVLKRSLEDPLVSASKRVIEILSEPIKEYTVEDFFHKLLPEIEARTSDSTERLEALIERLDIVEKPESEVPQGKVYECWLRKGESFLLFTLLFDYYSSTAFPDKKDGRLYGYFRISEWVETSKGGKIYDDSVHLRFDCDTFEGEWLWIRSAPSFTGGEAKEFAASLSRLFMKEALLWDTAKLKTVEKSKGIFLSRWNQMIRPEGGSYYGDKGFQVIDLKDVKGVKWVFTQSKTLHEAALLFLKGVKVKDLSDYGIGLRKKRLDEVIARYGSQDDTLGALAIKVDRAARQDRPLGKQDQVKVYDLISGDYPLKPTKDSDLIAMAIDVISRPLLLKAAPPYARTATASSAPLPFSESFHRYLSLNPKEPNDVTAFIHWSLS
jgi:hypothetical protein